MAVTYGATSTDNINFGSDASIDNLDAATLVAWINFNAVNTDQVLMTKTTDSETGTQVFLNGSGTSGSLIVTRSRATTDQQAVATLMATGWNFIAAKYDVAGAPQLFHGDLTTVVTEASSYTNQVNGSGAKVDESAFDLYAGNYIWGSGPTNESLSLNGDLGMFLYINRALTLGEIREIQFGHISAISGCVILALPGFDGASSIVDYSGNGNTGTGTGLVVADQMGIGNLFSDDQYKHEPVVGGITIPIFHHRYQLMRTA